MLFTGCTLLVPEDSIELAEKYMDRNKIEKAIEVYQALIDDDEEDYEAWFGLAQAYMEEEEFEDAGDTLTDMIEVVMDNSASKDKDFLDALDDYSDLVDDLADEDVLVIGLATTMLEEGQSSYILNKDGSMIFTTYIEDKDLEDSFDVDFDDKDTDIMSDIEDAMDDWDVSVEVTKFDKIEEFALITMLIEDLEDMGRSEFEQTIEDYVDDDSWYDDFDEFADDNDFVLFKNEDDVKSQDLQDYADLYMISVSGGDEGAYYEVPSNIVLVSDKVDFERVNNTTIYIDQDEYGYIAYEN